MIYNQKSYALGSKRSIIREIFEYAKKREKEIGKENVFDFSLGNPSVSPPKEVNDCLIELLNSENSTLLHGYTSAQGDLGVRMVVANHINSNFNAGISPDNIYMTCGAAASLTISLKALLNEGDEVIVFAPFFTEYTVFIENAGGKVVKSIPMEKTFQIDFNDFICKITPDTKAVIVNSPNNPSGVVYTEETIIKLAEILKLKSNEFGRPIYLICDEPYRELVYGDVDVPYLMNYYDNTLVCYSYSKALSLPGERIGYIAVCPKAYQSKEIYLSVCGAGRSLGYVCAPSLFQQVIKRCIDVKVDINVYKENRDLLYNNLINFGFEVVKPDGAFYLFVKSFTGDAFELYEKAKEFELLLVPCDDFGVTGYVRIAYCVDKQKIINSMPAFKKLAESYK